MWVRKRTRSTSVLFVLSTLTFVGVLLMVIAQARQDEFVESQRLMARSAVQGLSKEIGNLIGEKRRLVDLFIRNEATLIQQLLLHPDDDHLQNRLEARIADFFPDYAGVTLADGRGRLIVDDGEGAIGHVNEDDILKLARMPGSHIQVHPNDSSYGFDIITRLEGLSGILFVGFQLEKVKNLLNAVMFHQHEFMLINTLWPGLKEVTSKGGRDQFERDDFYLTLDQKRRIIASAAVSGTLWQLVDMGQPSLYADHWNRVRSQSFGVFASVALASLMLAGLLRRGERRGAIAERRLQQAKDRLESRVAARTKELCASKELAEVTLRCIGEGVITTDAKGVITALNATAEELTGWSESEAMGRGISEVFRLAEEGSAASVENPVTRCLREKQPTGIRDQAVMLGRTGKPITIQDSAAPIRDRNDRLVGVVMVFRDVTEARKLAHEVSWRASHDPLTGLINRSEFERRLQRVVDGMEMESGKHALLFMDLDQFKIVNDTCGHVAGDELLRNLSALLQKGVRRNDSLARLGGDEFALLLESCPLEQARRVAEHLRTTVRGFRFSWEGKVFTLSVSIGMVPVDRYYSEINPLLSAADSACYAAKDSGRNRIHVYTEDSGDMERRIGEMQWVSRLHEALDDERFRLYGQRIVPITEGPRGLHLEVLVRMIDEAGGLVPPGAFIPAAERYSLMPTLDRMVVRNTLKWLADLRELAARIDCCAINLSGQSLADPGFLDFVTTHVADSRIDPEKICFEITETATISNLCSAQQFIAAVKRLGCRFALDDFGSGMSSFAYLKNLPVDFLKIDGEFVKGIVDDPISLAMVKSINQVGQVMGKQTIAEYVESQEILAVLRHVGVHFAQGYGIARPCPLDELVPTADVTGPIVQTSPRHYGYSRRTAVR
jgi:diguanylate cyclase (GGDEF)-like protein/PAS domain S-box-containing protein